MAKWDYKTVVPTHGAWGASKGQLNRLKFDAALDDLGHEGTG